MDGLKSKLSRRHYLGLLTGLAIGLKKVTESPPVALGQTSLFGLPYPGPPGPATWYLRQWYGNTRWAYRQRRALYSAGQGLHFGLDFAASCGTPIQAIGDGLVISVDGPYGALPHNVLIRHANGLVSLYGHMLERSPLRIGQAVRQGEIVGHTGAPTGADCDTHPHVHLEIREGNLGGTRNPVNLIEADWFNLTLGGPAEGLQFQLDLDHPDRWQTIYDQPTVRFGAALYNDYAYSWP
jgi:murein DD-endopeptidase MepM/ murein hydrolase activator NlpD